MELGNLDLQVFFKKEIQLKGHIEEPGRVYYWVKMLEAVKAIHEHGIIHSDLKPSNFLLIGHEVKLIDFNISNEINDRTSMTVQNDCGTLYYMAPESIAQESQRGKISFKTDVWSLGCILYYMTYGRLPFQHVKNQFQLFMQLTNPDKQIKFAPLIDQDLMDVLLNTLKHHQKERYSIEELLNHKYVKSKL
jgi:serine/threonine-protein kinase TTK/MPS1